MKYILYSIFLLILYGITCFLDKSPYSPNNKGHLCFGDKCYFDATYWYIGLLIFLVIIAFYSRNVEKDLEKAEKKALEEEKEQDSSSKWKKIEKALVSKKFKI